MSSNIIEQLRDDKNYYGELGRNYLSNSHTYSLLNNPSDSRKNDKTFPLLLGRHSHTPMPEPDKIGEYAVVDSSTRSTKVFKEYVAENNLDNYDVLLQKEIETIDTMIVKSNFCKIALAKYLFTFVA